MKRLFVIIAMVSAPLLLPNPAMACWFYCQHFIGPDGDTVGFGCGETPPNTLGTGMDCFASTVSCFEFDCLYFVLDTDGELFDERTCLTYAE